MVYNNNEVAYNAMISCDNIVELGIISKNLHKNMCKWENKISNI